LRFVREIICEEQLIFNAIADVEPTYSPMVANTANVKAVSEIAPRCIVDF